MPPPLQQVAGRGGLGVPQFLREHVRLPLLVPTAHLIRAYDWAVLQAGPPPAFAPALPQLSPCGGAAHVPAVRRFFFPLKGSCYVGGGILPIQLLSHWANPPPLGGRLSGFLFCGFSPNPSPPPEGGVSNPPKVTRRRMHRKISCVIFFTF